MAWGVLRGLLDEARASAVVPGAGEASRRLSHCNSQAQWACLGLGHGLGHGHDHGQTRIFANHESQV
ncbi:hypothetical protein MY4824_009509 [Beauveria thailandica]